MQSDLVNRARLTWAHAVNSKSKLAALTPEVDFIECDIALIREGKIYLSHCETDAVDLCLEEMLTYWSSRKRPTGLKLDLKTAQVVQPVFELLQSLDTTGHLWINADVFGQRKKLDPASLMLFTTCPVVSALSLGIHGNEKDAIKAILLDVESQAIFHSCIDNQKHITFAINANAAYHPDCRDSIAKILQKFPGSSITLWTSVGETIAGHKINELIDVFGDSRVFADVSIDSAS